MDAYLAAADLLIGARCAGCGVAAWGLCAPCVELLRPRPFVVQRPQVAAPIVASGRYEAELAAGLVAWKEHNFERLTPLWSHHVAASMAALADDTVAVATVPTRPGRSPRHRFDAVVLDAAQRLTDVGVVVKSAPLLHWTRAALAQKHLDRQQRRMNMRHAFAAESGPRIDAPIVIVDDVVTTGMTLAAATRALQRRGHEVLGCAVIAATE